MKFTKGYENESGLLQGLESRIIAERSKVNDYVFDKKGQPRAEE